jgi:hypothetical protein
MDLYVPISTSKHDLTSNIPPLELRYLFNIKNNIDEKLTFDHLYYNLIPFLNQALVCFKHRNMVTHFYSY